MCYLCVCVGVCLFIVCLSIFCPHCKISWLDKHKKVWVSVYILWNDYFLYTFILGVCVFVCVGTCLCVKLCNLSLPFIVSVMWDANFFFHHTNKHIQFLYHFTLFFVVGISSFVNMRTNKRKTFFTYFWSVWIYVVRGKVK